MNLSLLLKHKFLVTKHMGVIGINFVKKELIRFEFRKFFISNI